MELERAPQTSKRYLNDSHLRFQQLSIVERLRYIKHSDAAIKYAVKLENEKKEFLSLMSLSKIVTKKLILNFYWKAYITSGHTKPHLTFSCRWVPII